MSDRIPNGIPQKVQVSSKEFNAKYADKTECYKFLTHDCGVYLCQYDNVTIWHMRDLCAGTRKRIYGKVVKHIHVPQYEGLTINDMLKFGFEYDSVKLALPIVEKEILNLHRQYIANVIYTRVGEPFQKWVDKQVEARHKKVAD